MFKKVINSILKPKQFTQSEKVKDVFGYENQSKNYELARPKYPKKFIKQAIQSGQYNNNYIDIACGTGQLLFQIAPSFQKEQSIILGNDISQKQLQQAQQHYLLDEYSNIDFFKGNFEQIPEFLEKNKIPKNTFDLVTIGQALHWFDTEKFFNICNEHLLTKNGRLVVLGYEARGFEYNISGQNDHKLGFKRYKEFYQKIEPYFEQECDRKSLGQGFKYCNGYDFFKHFKNVYFEEDLVKSRGNLDYYVNYLNTYSAYNTYVEKKSKNQDFEDPLKQFKENCSKDIQKQCQKEGIDLQQLKYELIYHQYYFMWILSNSD